MADVYRRADVTVVTCCARGEGERASARFFVTRVDRAEVAVVANSGWCRGTTFGCIAGFDSIARLAVVARQRVVFDYARTFEADEDAITGVAVVTVFMNHAAVLLWCSDHATLDRIARFHPVAGKIVVTHQGITSLAALNGVTGFDAVARIAVVTVGVNCVVHAPVFGVAGNGGALRAIVALERVARSAFALLAHVVDCAYVAVVALQVVRSEHTADPRIAHIVGARVGVVAGFVYRDTGPGFAEGIRAARLEVLTGFPFVDGSPLAWSGRIADVATAQVFLTVFPTVRSDDAVALGVVEHALSKHVACLVSAGNAIVAVLVRAAATDGLGFAFDAALEFVRAFRIAVNASLRRVARFDSIAPEAVVALELGTRCTTKRTTGLGAVAVVAIVALLVGSAC